MLETSIDYYRRVNALLNQHRASVESKLASIAPFESGLLQLKHEAQSYLQTTKSYSQEHMHAQLALALMDRLLVRVHDLHLKKKSLDYRSGVAAVAS
jgi:hypothetical protein